MSDGDKKERNKFISYLEPVRDLQITKNTTVYDLIKQFKYSGGFTTRKLWTAVKILNDMLNDKESVNFLSFPAAIIATGTRGIIRDLIKNEYFDVIVTTCGTLDHDIARCWRSYYNGWFNADDKELYELEIHRLGNVFIPFENYGLIVEQVMKEFLSQLTEKGIKELSTYELSYMLGEFIDKNCPNKEESILWWAWKKNVPIIIPGITDGAVGTQIWIYSLEKKFKIDVLKDESLLDAIVHNYEKSGALIIGGGISKHHVIWWNQFKEGLDRAVYITTAVEWDGSLSGARMREAISWGKLKECARYVTVEGDATVLLPLVLGYLVEENIERKGKQILREIIT